MTTIADSFFNKEKETSGRLDQITLKAHCVRSNKICYPDKISAMVALSAIQKRNRTLDGKMPKATYKCHHCNTWHLTSMSQGVDDYERRP